jgi:hypothetical protein
MATTVSFDTPIQILITNALAPDKSGYRTFAFGRRPACALYAFLITVQQLNLAILVSVLLLEFLAPYRFPRRMVEAMA